jgi:peptide deformylase
MSDMIKFNTEDAIKLDVVKPQITKIFDLVPENDPILRQEIPEFDFDNPPVNPTDFASALVETCKSHKGYGLSANQCGFRHRVFVMGTGDDYVAFFNPKIISTSGEVHMAEGCLSFPFLGLHITRPAIVDVEYQDFNGVVRTTKFSGVSARCFQHELDHLNGIVYTYKVKPMALQSGLKKRNKLLKMMKVINGKTN